MKCKYCKATDLPEHARFCPWCGKRQQEDAREISVPPPRQMPSGTFFGRITVKGERVSISAPTEAEYYAKARAIKAGLVRAKKNAPKVTLSSAIEDFVKENTNVLSPSTIKAYKSYADHRFQGIMAQDVSKINWQQAINEEAAEIAPKTLANVWRLITASLKAKGIDPPEVTLPKAPKAERPWLDYDEIQIFLAAVKDKPCELPALLALHGLRRSEILALTADKIDLDHETMKISGAIVYGPDGKLVEKATNKNRSSQRTVHIVIPRLKDLLEQADGKVVTAHPSTIHRQIDSACTKAGLPAVGIHGLRHSFASLAYHLGWSEMTTMREGGWSNSQTVHEIYTHLASKDANADIKRMKAFYKRGNKKSNKTAKP